MKNCIYCNLPLNSLIGSNLPFCVCNKPNPPTTSAMPKAATQEYIGEAFRKPYCEALRSGPVIWQAAFLGSDERVWAESTRLELPEFNAHALYRFKPTPKRMVTLGGKYGPVELVAPERDVLEAGCPFFYNNYCSGNPTRTTWADDNFDIWALRNGNVFLIREDAQAMADFQRKQRLGEV